MHKLTLEVELDAEAIAGKLSDEAGYSVQFGGWLGLASALDGYLKAAGAPPVAHVRPAALDLSKVSTRRKVPPQA